MEPMFDKWNPEEVTAVLGLGVAVLVAAGSSIRWWLSRRADTRHRHDPKILEAYEAFMAAMSLRTTRLVGDINMSHVHVWRTPEQDWALDPTTSLATLAVIAPEVKRPAQRFFDWYLLHAGKVALYCVNNFRGERPEFDADEYNRLKDEVERAMKATLGK
jgi:hypothetical protein